MPSVKVEFNCCAKTGVNLFQSDVSSKINISAPTQEERWLVEPDTSVESFIDFSQALGLTIRYHIMHTLSHNHSGRILQFNSTQTIHEIFH